MSREVVATAVAEYQRTKAIAKKYEETASAKLDMLATIVTNHVESLGYKVLASVSKDTIRIAIPTGLFKGEYRLLDVRDEHLLDRLASLHLLVEQ